jgi:predicted RNA-binding Zn ribbon-like protein
MPAGQTRAAPARAPGPLARVQDFLNSVHVERGTDELADLAAANRFLGAEMGPDTRRWLDDGWVISRSDLDRLVAIRGALRALIRVGTDETERADASRTLSANAHRVPVALRVDPDGRLQFVAAGTNCDWFIGQLMTSIQQAQGAGTWERLKICRADACAWVFYDTSRNHSATWCAMGVCGNRQKVTRHRQRRRQSRSDGPLADQD